MLTPEQMAAADQQRIAKLSAQSEADGVAFVEVVYRNKFVRFDIAELQAQCLTLPQVIERCFREPLEAISLPLAHDVPSLVGSAATDGGV